MIIMKIYKVATQCLKALNKHNTHNVHWDGEPQLTCVTLHEPQLPCYTTPTHLTCVTLHQPQLLCITLHQANSCVTLHQPNSFVLHYANPTPLCYTTPTPLCYTTPTPTPMCYTTPTQLPSVTLHQPNSPVLHYTNPTPLCYATPTPSHLCYTTTTQLTSITLNQPQLPCVKYTNPAHRYSCCSKPACWARVAAAAGRAGCAVQTEAAGTLAPAGTRHGNPTAPAPGERGTSWSGLPAPARPGLTLGWRCPASSATWPHGSTPGLWWKGTENGLNDCVHCRALQIAPRSSAQGLVFRICSFLETFLNELRRKNAGRHKCIYKHMHH